MTEQQLIKKQDQDISTVLIRQQLQQNNKRQERQSPYQEQYCQVIREECEPFTDYQDLEDDMVCYNPQHFQPNIVITIQQHTANYEVLKVNVRYGYFQTLLAILNVSTDSPSQQLSMVESGSFGRVYRAKYKKNLAIKSIHLVEDDFQNIFVEAVKEYFILKIASLIKAAPIVMDIYGFNLVIFKNAIEFSMEMCSTQAIQQQSSYQAALPVLTLKLAQLHQFKIIHNDIKPKNIAYSHIYGAYVYLDFGLSQMVKEDKGKMSWSCFVGSIQFCSKEMRELYINASDGWIDLYCNDAISLQNALQRIKSDLSQVVVDGKQGKYAFRQDTYKFYQAQLLIVTKCALYYNYLFSDLQNKFFLENEHFLRIHERQLKQFMYSLPQTQTLKCLWLRYMKESEDFESKEMYASTTSIKKQGFLTQNISQLVFSRFNIISQLSLSKKIGIKHQNIRKGENIYFLYDEKVVQLFTLNSYLRIFVQFIKINGTTECFQDKIKACEVFNVLYLHEEPPIKANVLYQKTIRYVWQHINSNFVYELYPILLNIIETIVIIEILTQQSLKKSFKNMFNIQNLSFIEKCATGLAYIASLEYAKAKMTTVYSKDTSQQLLSQLGLFIRENCMKERLAQKETSVFKAFCKLITIVSQSQQYKSLQCIHSDKQVLKSYKLFLELTEENIDIYIKNFSFSFFLSQIESFQDDRAIQILSIIKIRQNRFSYLHFPLFQLALKFQEEGVQSHIYQIFHRQFSWLGIESKFKLFLYYKIVAFQNYLQFKATSTHLDTSGHIQQDQEENKMLDQLSLILAEKISRRDKFHDLLRIFHQMNVYIIPSLNPLFSSFLKENEQQISSLILDYKESTKDHHSNMLKKNIDIIGEIKFYQIKHTSKEEGIAILEKFIKICLDAISKLRCLECKSVCLIQFKCIELHKLFLQGRRQQYMYLIANCLSFSMKSQETLGLVQKFIQLYIRNAKKIQSIDCDFEDLLYSIIKHHNNYKLCFMRISNYNIFIHVYLHIYRFYETQDMFIFMTNIFSLLNCMNSKYYRQFFYDSMERIISFVCEHQNRYMVAFQAIHNQLALDFKKHPNPYTSLYYSAILNLKLRGSLDRMIIFNIARYINMVDFATKLIILSNYFYYFAYYLSNSSRKQKYLLSRHTTYSFSIFPQNFILKERIKSNISKGKDKKFYRLLCRRLLIFHKNIGNIMEQKN